MPGSLGPGETECSVCRGADSFIFFGGEGPGVNVDDEIVLGELELDADECIDGNENDDDTLTDCTGCGCGCGR